MDLKFERDPPKSYEPPKTTGRVRLGIEILFLNSAMDAKGRAR